MTRINTYDVWQALISEVNIQQRGQVRPVSDFLRWYNKISEEMFREKVAAAELSQQLDDDLSPFKKSINVIVTPQAGQPSDLVRYPADYNGFADMRILRQKNTKMVACDCNLPTYEDDGKCLQIVDQDYAAMEARYLGMNLVEITVIKVDTQRWGAALNHATKGPTFESPKITQDKNGFRIAPKALTSVVLDYYTTPIPATFNYTISGEDIVIYDAATSVDLQWSNTLMGEFVARLKKIYATHVNAPEIYQMAQNDQDKLL